MLKLFCFILLQSYGATLNSAFGSVVELGGLKSYVSGSPHSTRAIILASDFYGYKVPNLRAIADKVAADGFYVVVPDFFRGDPFDPTNPERPREKWILSHPTGQGVEDAKSVIDSLRNHGICSIGVAGFCWGGKVAAVLSLTEKMQAVVLSHPVNVTVAEIKEVEEPIAIFGAEFDELCPVSLVKQYEEVLSTKPEVESYVKIFSGVGHGFTTRYDLKDEKAVKAAEEAKIEMLDWFVKYVK